MHTGDGSLNDRLRMKLSSSSTTNKSDQSGTPAARRPRVSAFGLRAAMIPVKLTIDGHPASVPPGTTILAAARTLGLAVPTLCHVEGFDPSASCFLCAVKIEGRPNLWPSCATPVAAVLLVVLMDVVGLARHGARCEVVQLILRHLAHLLHGGTSLFEFFWRGMFSHGHRPLLRS